MAGGMARIHYATLYVNITAADDRVIRRDIAGDVEA